MTAKNLECISSDELWKFIVAEPLLSYFFLRSTIEEIPNYIAVAAVSISGGQITLRLNPTVISRFTTKQKIGTLVHEYLHVLLQHCTSRMHHKKGTKAKKENYAMDMAINQIIRKVWDLPDFALFHDKEEFGFPPDLSAEEYFKLIDEKYPDDEFEKNFGTRQDMDSHEDWGNPSPEDYATIKDLANSYMQSYNNDLGETLSSSSKYNSLLEKIVSIELNEIHWPSIVRHFVQQVASNSTKRTLKRPNKRFGFPIPGVGRKNTVKAAAIVDTSISMTPKLLSFIGGQLNMMTQSMQIDVLMCDTNVEKDGIVKRFRPSASIDFHGRRGTDLQPAFSLAEKDGYKAAICFTDGFLGKEIACKLPTLWVCINNKAFSPAFGKVIHVNWKEV